MAFSAFVRARVAIRYDTTRRRLYFTVSIGYKLILFAAPTLAEFLNWMPSTEPPDDGAAEDIQESAEAALAATSQGI
jgi:hypothetical protein